MSDRVTRSRSKEKSPNVSGTSSVSTPRGVGDNTSYRSDDTFDVDDESDGQGDNCLDNSEDLADHISLRSHSGYSEYLEAAGSLRTSPKGTPVNFSDPETPSPPRANLYPTLREFKPDSLVRPELHQRKRASPKSHESHRTRLTVDRSTQRCYYHRVEPRQALHGPSDAIDSGEDYLADLWNRCHRFYTKYRDTCFICLAVVLLFTVLYLVMPFLIRPEDPANAPPIKSERDQIMTRFEQEFKLFQSKFIKQSGVMLRTLKAASKSVMRETNPIKPGIIMLAGNRKAFDTVDCIAKHMLNITTRAYDVENFVEIKQEDLKKLRIYHDVKKYLEDNLRAGFAAGKVALIHSLESMHGKAAMLFHAFCDNENAPFKDTVIIFTVHLDSDDDITDEDQVEGYLDEIWQDDLDIDSRSPLMTRIANFVAVVTPESEATLNKHC